MSDFALIFDMDGVIADTGDLHEKAWLNYCKKHKISISSDLFRDKLFGRSNRECFEILLDRKILDDELQVFIDEKETLFRDSARGKLHALPGLIQLLEMLKNDDLKMCVASSAPRINVEFILRETQTEKYFDSVTSAEDVLKSKPDPAIFLLSAEKMNISPNRCLVFEDSFAGIEAAEKAGMKVIMLTTSHTAEVLPKNHPAFDDFVGLSVGFIKNLMQE